MTGDDPIDILAQIWDTLLQDANPTRREQQMFFAEILGQYLAPGRYHRGVGHLVALTHQARNTPLYDPVPVFLAIFYHDYIYETRKGAVSNEEQSAAAARRHLTVLGFPEAIIARTETLIRLTETHDIDARQDRDAALFLDMDMSILGARRSLYESYAWDIRREFSRYNDAQFCAGRLDFIDKMLARPRIFLTSTYATYEAQARDNLRHERQVLQKTGVPLRPLSESDAPSWMP